MAFKNGTRLENGEVVSAGIGLHYQGFQDIFGLSQVLALKKLSFNMTKNADEKSALPCRTA